MTGPIVPRSTFNHGRKSNVGTSVVTLVGDSIKTKRGVLIKAASGNSGKVYVGISTSVTADSNDGTDGFELSAGDSLEVEINDVRSIHIIASESGQKVFWIGV